MSEQSLHIMGISLLPYEMGLSQKSGQCLSLWHGCFPPFLRERLRLDVCLVSLGVMGVSLLLYENGLGQTSVQSLSVSWVFPSLLARQAQVRRLSSLSLCHGCIPPSLREGLRLDVRLVCLCVIGVSLPPCERGLGQTSVQSVSVSWVYFSFFTRRAQVRRPSSLSLCVMGVSLPPCERGLGQTSGQSPSLLQHSLLQPQQEWRSYDRNECNIRYIHTNSDQLDHYIHAVVIIYTQWYNNKQITDKMSV